MALKHNCCKENNFEWISIDPLGNSADRLVCKICEREFIDTIFIKRLKEITSSQIPKMKGDNWFLRQIDKLSGLK